MPIRTAVRSNRCLTDFGVQTLQRINLLVECQLFDVVPQSETPDVDIFAAQTNLRSPR